jgi:hypothetical protein
MVEYLYLYEVKEAPQVPNAWCFPSVQGLPRF